MNKFKKVFVLIRTHPKKIICFSALASLGANYGRHKYNDHCLMRKSCMEALKFGNVPQSLASKERHITVILNPAANNGKSKSLYEKYCAPLLHLSGMKVALVKTEHEGQARQIMDVMENTDGVIVAGGDGTLSEVITGLLRRNDRKSASRKLPLGILPLGQNNSAASSIWCFNRVPEVKHLTEATMDIVRDFRRKFDVLEVTPIEDSDGTPRKPVYASSSLEWGALRDAKERKSVYWYWASLKKYVVYVFSSYKDLTWKCNADIEYFPPCKGCHTCKSVNEDSSLEQKITEPSTGRWWKAFVPKVKQVVKEDLVDYSSIVNEECGKGKRMRLENVSDIRICSRNCVDSTCVPGHSMAVKIGGQSVSTLDFIQEGWRRERGEVPSFESEVVVGEVRLTPSEDSLTNAKGEDRKLSIDNEAFEVKAMRIRALPEAVTIFAPPLAA